MDLSATIVPKSDQLNAEDLLTGPITVTVDRVVVKPGSEQPVDIHLIETPGRCFRPSKTQRRLLIKAWGQESDTYPGRRLTLYRDPNVKYGGQKVGGVKISHLSHIEKEFTIALTETRGKRTTHTVKPLPQNSDAGPRNTPAHEGSPNSAEPRVGTFTLTPDMVANSTDINQLREWQQREPKAHDAIETRIRHIAATAAAQGAEEQQA